MRHLQLQIRSENAERIVALADEYDAAHAAAMHADRVGMDGGVDGEWSLVFVEIPNDRVGSFVEAVRQEVGDTRFVLFPFGTLPLRTPLEQVDPRVQDVSGLSTVELVLSSMQSVGSWKGMLLYSALAGVIGAYGVIFDVAYLLVAAMLINPMGAPALVSVIGLAIGDVRMFGRGGLRFLVSLLVQAAAALVLGFGYRLSVSTEMMEQVSNLSSWAVAVALAAGAAGAQTQVKSDRDSLVSGTAAGFMVAAALAPPAAVLGLSVPLGRWDYAELMAFLLLLQFVAIVLGGWGALRIYGVRPRDPSIGRGARAWRAVLLAAAVAATVALVWWQAEQGARFRKADLSRQALELARTAVAAVPAVRHVESAARFTRPEHGRFTGEAMLVEVVVEQQRDARETQAEQSAAIRAAVQSLFRDRMPDVVPFVDVTILPAPDAPI